MVVDWADYVGSCLRDGHNPETVRARVETAVANVYGPQYKKEVAARLDLMFQ
jgi:hypothetical protein